MAAVVTAVVMEAVKVEAKGAVVKAAAARVEAMVAVMVVAKGAVMGRRRGWWRGCGSRW